MNKITKQIIFLVVGSSICLTGCMSQNTKTNGTTQATNTKAVQVSSASSPSDGTQTTKENENAQAANNSKTAQVSSSETNNNIDYSQYNKKVWVNQQSDNAPSFYITGISNGKITGSFSSNTIAVPTPNYPAMSLGKITGTIKDNTAVCQFSDTMGNKGSIKMVFLANNEIQATISTTAKSQYTESQTKEGTFQFVPYNIKNLGDSFIINNSQSFDVNLNSWGNVKFVSGEILSPSRKVTDFLITNKQGDIIYSFSAPFPYGYEVKAVSFIDVKKNGLKDIIILCRPGGSDDNSDNMAKVFLQNPDGTFTDDTNLDQEINNSNNNKNMESIMNYISKKQ